MDVQDLTRFAEDLSDDLTPRATSTGHGLGALLADAEAITDDAALTTVMVAAFRLTTIGNYLLAATTHRAHATGVPVRHHLTTGRDLLRQLPLSPAAVAKLGRLSDNLTALPNVARDMRDGDLSLDHADAVICGLNHVASRVDHEGFTNVQASVATRLLAHAHTDTPSQIAQAARTIAHELAPTHPPVIPPAENPMLNQATITHTEEGRIHLDADLDQLSGEKLIVALDGLTRPIPAPDGGPDPRTRAQRVADGLVDIIDTYLARPARPTSGGIVPHINLTIPLPIALPASAAGSPNDAVARLGYTGAISPHLAREVCCGNNDITTILMADSVPLDISRTVRLATGALRHALIARDHGCQFPGCGKPPSWTDAHHIRPWADGGETVLDNLVLLCRFHHHTAIHTQGWKVRIGSDNHPWFQSPSGGDWIRSHARRSLTMAPTAAT